MFTLKTKNELLLGGYKPWFNPKMPDQIWYKGVLPKQPLISIVGTRMPTKWSIDFAHTLGRLLAEQNVGTVSGGAVGIDAAVHEGTLCAQGYTCVVLGCGIEQTYPPQHDKLFAKVIELNGCILSIFPPGSKPIKTHFPHRNFIIAMMGLATVIIEGNLHSGTMHTAQAAKKIGRPVFAVPGSSATNQLIQQGATPLLEPMDLFSFLKNSFFCNNLIFINNFRQNEDIKKEINCLFPLQQFPEPVELMDALNAVLDEKPRDPGELSAKANISLGTCLSLLLWLEVNKKCLRLPGDLYVSLTVNK